jgi:hypothetical protein
MFAAGAYTGFLPRLANLLQARVIAPVYRLAPEHPSPRRSTIVCVRTSGTAHHALLRTSGALFDTRRTQRNPMWLIPVSTICGRRAAGR